MNQQYREIFTRNIGLFTEVEQEKISKARVAIAGVGGIGALATERLVRLGVGNIKITDPGKMEVSNLNRQYGSSMSNIGENKAKVAVDYVQDINPDARVVWTEAGIHDKKDADAFVEDCDFLIDVMDFGLFKQSILLQRAARKNGVHYLFSTAIGFGAIAVVFDPNGITLEEYNGLPINVNVDDPRQLQVPLHKIVPVMPTYAPDIQMVQDIIDGKRYVPTTSIGAGLAAIMSATEAINIILGRESPKAPKYIFCDLVDRQLVVRDIQ
ncbi:MAG TPA: ThiF family adenylyltransferase [Dehalococcoidales bacterium]|nr:ThiF family adenylyltransferase [Dehalococcoidales bacterium]